MIIVAYYDVPKRRYGARLDVETDTGEYHCACREDDDGSVETVARVISDVFTAGLRSLNIPDDISVTELIDILEKAKIDGNERWEGK